MRNCDPTGIHNDGLEENWMRWCFHERRRVFMSFFSKPFGGVLSTDAKPFDIAIVYFNDCGLFLYFRKLFERIL